MDKNARVQLFYERLKAAPPASTHDEGYELLCTTLNQVEDEYSGVPYNPENFENDGRLYPPQADSKHTVDSFPKVVRYRHRKHNTFIASNGAIEVRQINPSDIQFTKPGANGKGVWDA